MVEHENLTLLVGIEPKIVRVEPCSEQSRHGHCNVDIEYGERSYTNREVEICLELFCSRGRPDVMFGGGKCQASLVKQTSGTPGEQLRWTNYKRMDQAIGLRDGWNGRKVARMEEALKNV
ncbi:hypothetical protein PoB_007255000 [Plakobranchus ocellatus]|uniref:Uncharacterized protein n=1 Tax=Plakobranchus ocellatus TaxID=259542 RepID=A0AAV4DPJ3_9GAST|nr:hypothetical protein PoB_007255000 [Plakobranchus ocellatus]